MKTLLTSLCLTIAVLLGSVGVSWSEGTAELRPLQDILREESSNTMKIYAIKRCSSLFFGVADGLRTRGEETKEIADKYNELGTELVMDSFLLSENFGFKPSMEKIRDTVFGILALYKKLWRHNSLATGHSHGPLTESDLETCTVIYNAIQSNVQKGQEK